MVPESITAAAAAIRSGALSSEELTAHCLERATALDGGIGAYIARFDETALAAAREADRELRAGHDRGPLHGIPIAVKDILATVEGPSTAQCEATGVGWPAGADAEAVARLRRAGSVFVGKTSMAELALSVPVPSAAYPTPRNPWNRAHWAGGSSSGSASGVAAGFFLGALGTDTGGSIRLPAAFCGVTGLMPTYGAVPRTGCVPSGYTIDRIGPLAASAQDCMAILRAIAGPDPHDRSTRGAALHARTRTAGARLDGVRVGVVRPPGIDGGDPLLVDCFDDAIDELRALGAATSPFELDDYDAVLAANYISMAAEGLATYHGVLRSQWDRVGDTTRARMLSAAVLPAAYYVQGQRVRHRAQRRLAGIFRDVDVLALPTSTIGAPAYDNAGRVYLRDLVGTSYTQYWDAVGNPAISVPMGVASTGLPLGLQLVGPPFEEENLGCVAEAYQQATPWHRNRPPDLALAEPIRAADAGDRASVRPAATEGTPARSDRVEALAALLDGSGLPIGTDEAAALAAEYVTILDQMQSVFELELDRHEEPALVFFAEPF